MKKRDYIYIGFILVIVFIFWIDHNSTTNGEQYCLDQLNAQQKTDYKDQLQQDKLMQCITNAQLSHAGFWEAECTSRGLQANCPLPSYNANRIDDSFKESKEDCFRIYSTAKNNY